LRKRKKCRHLAALFAFKDRKNYRLTPAAAVNPFTNGAGIVVTGGGDPNVESFALIAVE